MEPSAPPPLVSVIMPLRNAAAYVEAAARSVLLERSVPLELVVVDDHSEDDSMEQLGRVADPRVRVVPGPAEGISAAMNAGLAAARGEIVMRCDADDLYPEGRIPAQVAWLARHPGYGAVCGGYRVMSSAGDLMVDHETGATEREITAELRNGRLRTHLCTFALRTTLARELGGFRTFFETAEDIDFQLRLADRTRIFYEPACRYVYRLHDASITHRGADARRRFFDELARELQRQRQQEGSDDLDQGRIPEIPAGIGARSASSAQKLAGFLEAQAWREFQRGRKWQAIRTSARMLRVGPVRWASWRSACVLLLKCVLPRQQAGEG